MARRGVADSLDEVREVDADARRLRTAVEDLRAERGRASKAIGQAKREGRDSSAEEAAARELGDRLARDEERLREVDAQRDALLAALPNLSHPDAPDGGEEDSAVVRTVGAKPEFAFDPRDHVAIAEGLGGLEIEQATKISGARFAYLMGPLVRLQLALVNHVVGVVESHGFTPVVPPVLVREDAMYSTGFFPTDRSNIYALADDDLFLVGTSEVPLAGLGYDRIMDPDALPLRYAGMSTCFRREAGAAGRDTGGIFRVHQFDKVEMFSFCRPEDSEAEHARILAIEEEILGSLGLHYRVMDIAIGDLGAPAYRKFDLEAWLPGQGRYRELTSCSNCTDYQARRLDCRIKEGKATRPVHTLNGTATAVGRTLIALLETHQREDGSVVVPDALQAAGAPPLLTPPVR